MDVTRMLRIEDENVIITTYDNKVCELLMFGNHKMYLDLEQMRSLKEVVDRYLEEVKECK